MRADPFQFKIRTTADEAYADLIHLIVSTGWKKVTRNSPVFTTPFANKITFTSAPLVTLRPTAWEKAVREMEWFLSGEPNCPDDLSSWWEDQLSKNEATIDWYVNGYGKQFRCSSFQNSLRDLGYFDQIKFLLKELKEHPNSRRLILSSWNPGEMRYITETNSNPKTPTTCHTTVAQFFVSPKGELWLKSYQRSADILLGVPHNWIQSWAMLVWFAAKTGYSVGGMVWDFGDLHLYDEPSHLSVAKEIMSWRERTPPPNIRDVELLYSNSHDDLVTSDFVLKIPDWHYLSPVSSIRPKLL